MDKGRGGRGRGGRGAGRTNSSNNFSNFNKSSNTKNKPAENIPISQQNNKKVLTTAVHAPIASRISPPPMVQNIQGKKVISLRPGISSFVSTPINSIRTASATAAPAATATATATGVTGRIATGAAGVLTVGNDKTNVKSMVPVPVTPLSRSGSSSLQKPSSEITSKESSGDKNNVVKARLPGAESLVTGTPAEVQEDQGPSILWSSNSSNFALSDSTKKSPYSFDLKVVAFPNLLS